MRGVPGWKVWELGNSHWELGLGEGGAAPLGSHGIPQPSQRIWDLLENCDHPRLEGLGFSQFPFPVFPVQSRFPGGGVPFPHGSLGAPHTRRALFPAPPGRAGPREVRAAELRLKSQKSPKIPTFPGLFLLFPKFSPLFLSLSGVFPPPRGYFGSCSLIMGKYVINKLNKSVWDWDSPLGIGIPLWDGDLLLGIWDPSFGIGIPL